MTSSGLQTLGEAGFAHFEQLRLGLIENADGILALVSGLGDRGRADAHEAAQHALVFDDADVIFNDRTAGQTLSERSQIGYASDGLDFLIAGKLIGDGDDVDGAAGVH